MSNRHTIGPTSQPHYPAASVAGWMALWAQHLMDARWSASVRDRQIDFFARDASFAWSVAESGGLVLQ